MSVSPETYDHILTKGLQSSLNSLEIDEGKLRYTTDTCRLYLDLASSRIRISDIIDTYTEAQILAIIAPLPKIYVSTDTHRAFVSDYTNWYDLGSISISLATTTDTDVPVWFGDPNAASVEPTYVAALSYNTSTQELKTPKLVASTSVKVGSMLITDTLDDNNITHTVEFSIV